MRRLFIAVIITVLIASTVHALEVDFGRYYIDNALELRPIQWLVLDEDEDTLLLLARDCIDQKPYNERRVNITWENSTLNKWLNGEFFSTAFTTQEQAAITRDGVFLLTADDVAKYMSRDSERQCRPTTYARSRGVYVNGAGLCAWWTSSPGRIPTQAAYLSSTGAFGNRPHYVDDDVIGVRPAVRVSKSFFAEDTSESARYLFSIKSAPDKAQEVESRLQPLVAQDAPFKVKELYNYFLRDPKKALEEFDMKRFAVEGVVLRTGPDGVFGQPASSYPTARKAGVTCCACSRTQKPTGQ